MRCGFFFLILTIKNPPHILRSSLNLVLQATQRKGARLLNGDFFFHNFSFPLLSFFSPFYSSPTPSKPSPDSWGGRREKGECLDYKEKRRRNTIAVRKCRALSKERKRDFDAEVERLRMDNEQKARKIETLRAEIEIYKDLFAKSGFVALVPK